MKTVNFSVIQTMAKGATSWNCGLFKLYLQRKIIYTFPGTSCLQICRWKACQYIHALPEVFWKCGSIMGRKDCNILGQNFTLKHTMADMCMSGSKHMMWWVSYRKGLLNVLMRLEEIMCWRPPIPHPDQPGHCIDWLNRKLFNVGHQETLMDATYVTSDNTTA